LSAPSGGAGAVAQPAKTPAAINVIERRFIIRFGDEILETELDFHWAEIPDVLREPTCLSDIDCDSAAENGPTVPFPTRPRRRAEGLN
jgi:hypothetical protein